MVPSSTSPQVSAGGGQAVGFSRGIAVGFISAMIGFLLMQKIINLHTHHITASFDNGMYKQQGDMLEPPITFADLKPLERQSASKALRSKVDSMHPDEESLTIKTSLSSFRPPKRRSPGDAKKLAIVSSANKGGNDITINANDYSIRSQDLEEAEYWASLKEAKPKSPQTTAASKLTLTVGNILGSMTSSFQSSSAFSSSSSTPSPPSPPSFKLSRQECDAKYSKKSYFPDEKKRLPPMLYTFPGSGNTWSRLLIEHATGIYSGSVYDDKTLLEALPGEFTCNWQVSVVKVHPHTHPFEELHSGKFNSDHGKCKKGGVKRFERAVLLIRNPFDSIWSEYQRRITQSHVEGIRRKNFDWSRWQANAAAMSNSYHQMWSVQYAGIEAAFKKEDILYIRYEDLKDKKKRVETLAKVTQFLHVDASDERLECAFLLSESTKAHRSIDPKVEMTKEVAFTKELVCRMWSLFGAYASRHGYSVWGDHNCAGYPAIPKVNVGPQGEYNLKWVKPGQKLLDFGGHEDSNALDLSGSTPSSIHKTGMSSVAMGKSLRKVGQSVKVLGINTRSTSGMTLQAASGVNGISNLGKEKAAWAR